MKTTVKYALSAAGIFPVIDLIRRMPETLSWARAGCRGVTPAPVKRMVLNAYLRDYRLKRFVETGTHLGDTLNHVARDASVLATSIELDGAYFDAAKKRFSRYANVELLHGDSGLLMPSVVAQLDAPALFWLDGHYSGGNTDRDRLETPVSAELEAIFQSKVPGHVILVDDVRCFDGCRDYPVLEDVLRSIRTRGCYDAEVSTDILRLTPAVRPKRANW